MPAAHRFLLGPWHIGRGADPFGPPVRPPVCFDDVLATAVTLGFQGIQFHDDDAVPDLESLPPAQIEAAAREMKRKLDDRGLVAEFVAPRLLDHDRGVGVDARRDQRHSGRRQVVERALNDQNGLKFDQDKVFNAVNLRGAVDQVRVPELAGYADTGAFVGFDVKAQRTQKAASATADLATSKAIFLRLVEEVRSFPEKVAAECVANRDYEAPERTVLEDLLSA